MTDKHNTHTSLVILSPIEHRHDDPEGRLRTVASTLETEARKAEREPQEQILRKCPMLHMARFEIIDNLIPEIGQRPPDSLKTKYLLFVAEVDGSIDDFFDAIYNGPQFPFDWAEQKKSSEAHAEFVNNIWGQCIGYPEASDNVFFRQYMHRCRIKVQLPFAAYTHTVAEIKHARDNQVKFAAFVEANQGMNQPDLLKNWQAFVDEYEPFAAEGRLSIRRSGRRGKRLEAGSESGVPPQLLHRSEHRPDREEHA